MAIVVNSFRAGLISERVDRLKSAEIVQNGLLRADNVVIQPQGGVRARPGLQLLANLNDGLPAGMSESWRRLFAWDKSPEERLNVAYSESGRFRVMLERGELIDVEGRGNVEAQGEMQAQVQGNRIIFTDGREPKHILANPVNVGGDVVLLTNQTGATTVMTNYAPDPPAAYEQFADQPISLSAFNNTTKTAALSVGEFRSAFTPADGGAGQVLVFSNNPHTYKGGSPTEITIRSVERQSDNHLRLRLSDFPAWLEKAVVSWGDTQNPDQYSREFTAADSRSTVLSGAELTQWNNARGVYSVRLERRLGGETNSFVQSSAFVVVESGAWEYYQQMGTASLPGFGDGFRLTTARTGEFWFGSVDTRPLWTPRNSAQRYVEYNFTGALERKEITLSVQSGGTTVFSQTLPISARVRFTFPSDAVAIAFNRGVSGNLSNNNERVTSTIRLTNSGLEEVGADFVAMAVTHNAAGLGRPVYIRGRDFFMLNDAGDLTRLPLQDNRVVNALIVDSHFRNQASVILQTFRERVLPLVWPRINPLRFRGDVLARLLTTSDFLAFRPPIINPPLVFFEKEEEWDLERRRIGPRFCFNTANAHSEGVAASATEGEYEFEFAAAAPVDEYGSQLTPVGTNGNARPDLHRRGITEVFEDRSTTPPTVREVTGWKYGNSTDIPSPLHGTIVNVVGNDIYLFPNSPVAEFGTLVARRVDRQIPVTSLIGKAAGRYAMAWNDTDGWPVSATSPQNRLAYAGSRTYPARIWMSVIGEPANFLDTRPPPPTPADGDVKAPVARANYAVRLDLDTSAIRDMVNDAALLVFTQNEAHIANGPFNALNQATSHTRRFGRLGQEFNTGSAIIDENVFIFANGAPFGLLYDGIDIGYISQNLSAQRNEKVMENYRGRTIASGAEGTDRQVYEVGPLADVTAIGDYSQAAQNEDLRPVRIVATQPHGLNGAYLVLYLMSDGTVRAFHTLHREGFFAWARWDFFEAANKNIDGSDKIGSDRRKIIDISAQGRLVTLLDNTGRIYTLNGEQPWDDLNESVLQTGNENEKRDIAVELELPSFALLDPRFPGQALINPKRLEFLTLFFNPISGENAAVAHGDKDDTQTISLEPDYQGIARHAVVEGADDEGGAPKATKFYGQRRVEFSAAFTANYDTDRKFTVTITHTGKEQWELLRAEAEVEVSSIYPGIVRAAEGGKPGASLP